MAQFNADQSLAIALQHHQAGHLPQAEELYRQILTHHPNHAHATHLLGVVAFQQGRSAIAVELISRAITYQPNWPEAHNHLGNALRESGQLERAIEMYKRAIDLNSNYVDAHFNLANAFRAGGQIDHAVAGYRKTISLRPDIAAAHSRLGDFLRQQGQLNEAIAALRQAVVLVPSRAEGYYELGLALSQNARLDEAIAAYRQAIALSPDYHAAYNNLGGALIRKGQLDQAMITLQRAISLHPNFPEAYNNLGNVFKEAGQIGEAIAAFRQAIAIQSDFALAYSNLLISMEYSGDHDASAIADEQRQWNRLFAKPLRKFLQPHVVEVDKNRRLKIGYVSSDFTDHVVGRNLLPLLSHHDHQQFDITCYSDVLAPGEATQKFQQFADRWRSVVGQSDEQLAARVREDKIDILVDLGLHTARNRLLAFARKPTPLQITFAGYPGSTGLDTIDYRLSDPYIDPDGTDESIYSEKTIRLPESFWCYDPGNAREIAVNSLPALESDLFTFGCLNNFCKVNDYTIKLWARILNQVTSSRLLLLSPVGTHRLRTLEKFANERIDPRRIEFVDRQSRRAYMSTYHKIDLGLDTFPYNAHSTGLDAMWMGVPVVTLVGNRPVSRAGWCHLSNVSLTELAGHDPEEFVNIAVGLAKDMPRLEQYRSALRQRMEQSPLMDAVKFARNIEHAYRQMWHTWCDTVSIAR